MRRVFGSARFRSSTITTSASAAHNYEDVVYEYVHRLPTALRGANLDGHDRSLFASTVLHHRRQLHFAPLYRVCRDGHLPSDEYRLDASNQYLWGLQRSLRGVQPHEASRLLNSERLLS